VAYQFVSHDCGAGLGVLKAEVAHGREPLSWFGLRRVANRPLVNHTPGSRARVERADDEIVGPRPRAWDRESEGEKVMRAITLACRKGGTGKSTLCVGLAVAAMEDGERVFILETDRQGTISNWAARRTNPEPVVERIANRSQLERALRPSSRGATR
jgi:Mrp family chromosome partitioning ATPase